jgi:hypothetical protein
VSVWGKPDKEREILEKKYFIKGQREKPGADERTKKTVCGEVNLVSTGST